MRSSAAYCAFYHTIFGTLIMGASIDAHAHFSFLGFHSLMLVYTHDRAVAMKHFPPLEPSPVEASKDVGRAPL